MILLRGEKMKNKNERMKSIIDRLKESSEILLNDLILESDIERSDILIEISIKNHIDIIHRDHSIERFS